MTKIEAILAAHARSRIVGYAYAVETADRSWIVADRKPGLRANGCKVIECEDGQERIA